MKQKFPTGETLFSLYGNFCFPNGKLRSVYIWKAFEARKYDQTALMEAAERVQQQRVADRTAPAEVYE
ncbi:hypothetical protein HMPREF1981_03067 [Bacteroides pyogenes F0041]|uniref:Uncharacterized protein n=1 Tax=Bacteroides pyogenes F0041 TaxID=1321819 RepID=U2CCE0_9BACE|nr:hypothetical protein HMPREF1981_03067 [Bacteroides pyogenes F0041]GAE20921.1 hypothetical protein JCM10003_306 [Bacteroides pyogenes JCM 10003]